MESPAPCRSNGIGTRAAAGGGAVTRGNILDQGVTLHPGQQRVQAAGADLLALVRELVDRGHRVTYATDSTMRDTVVNAGATLLAVPELAPPASTASGGPAAGGPAAGLLAILHGQLQLLRDRTLDAHLRAVVPDAVLVDALTAAGRVAAARTGVPSIGLNPSFATNEHFSLRDLAGHDPAPGVTTAVEQIQAGIRELAAEDGVPADVIFGGAPAPLSIVFLPREFQYAGDTFDHRYRFVGPCLGARVPDPSWQPPGDGRPLLFIFLGTTRVSNNAAFFRTCLDAFADGTWNLALAVGRGLDQAQLGPIPDHAQVRPYFPQLQVLDHAAAFVSHAGMNSTMESLYYGVPLVAVPQQPEQQAIARRIEQHHLGRRLAPAVTAHELRQAVEDIHADEQTRRSLDQMRRLVRSGGGATAAADAIETHLRLAPNARQP